VKYFVKNVFLYLPALLAVILAGIAVQAIYLEPHAGYRAFVAAAARVGPRVAIVAAVVLITDLAALAVYGIRQGKTDPSEGAIVDDGPLPMDLGIPIGRSKRKILVSKSQFVSVESLVTGTATPGERAMVAGIFILYVSFFSIFLGGGLMLMKGFVLAIFAPVIPGILVASLVYDSWTDYREVKAKSRASSRGGCDKPVSHKQTSAEEQQKRPPWP